MCFVFFVGWCVWCGQKHALPVRTHKKTAFVENINPSLVIPSWPFFIMFGALQLCLSMLPDFADLSIVSLVGALMSICYS